MLMLNSKNVSLDHFRNAPDGEGGGGALCRSVKGRWPAQEGRVRRSVEVVVAVTANSNKI